MLRGLFQKLMLDFVKRTTFLSTWLCWWNWSYIFFRVCQQFENGRLSKKVCLIDFRFFQLPDSNLGWNATTLLIPDEKLIILGSFNLLLQIQMQQAMPVRCAEIWTRAINNTLLCKVRVARSTCTAHRKSTAALRTKNHNRPQKYPVFDSSKKWNHHFSKLNYL